MNDDVYNELAIERLCQAGFGLKLTITELVACDIATGYTSTATVFKTTPTALYVLLRSQGTLLLADVKKIIRQMNLEADDYLSPHGDSEYFKRIGIEKFKAMFPGKHIVNDDDIRYYQTLAPYNPALVRIAKANGDIRAFHYESKSWRKVRDYTFNKITLVQ